MLFKLDYCKRETMKTKSEFGNVYRGMALIADPIHHYALFTVPISESAAETTEKELIDSPWVQRLRRIYQLQSARWVYPAAEHTRFQHSLGTMHMAGVFGRHLYASLHEVCPDVPSLNYIEELLRVAGLLHDVGHGPYGHFFDDNFLDTYRLTHELLGQQIIIRKLGKIISRIIRSPSGVFAKGERLDPKQVAFLIKKPSERSLKQPRWLQLLRHLFSGIYTVDNLDYVQRDAYTTGFSLDIVDIDRLRFYTFFTAEGLTLHQAGISALSRFLNARLNLYTNVYFHRTTRALDLHLQEIFRDTMATIFPFSPAEALDEYLRLDEWGLYHEVRAWQSEREAKKRKLGQEWARLHNREVKWKMSFTAEFSIDQIPRGVTFSRRQDYEDQIRAQLPLTLKKIPLRVDLATQDPRPLNPMMETEKRINIFNPATGLTSPEPLHDIYRFIPARVVHFRVFSLSHDYDEELAVAAAKAINGFGEEVNTNI